MNSLHLLADSGNGPKGAERLASRIEHMISSRGLEPGAAIGTKQALCSSSGMAMPSVNEAIRILESRGRVTVKPGPGGGVFVAEPDPILKLGRTVLAIKGNPESMSDAIVLRDALEPLIAADAARHRDERDIADLRLLIEEMAALIDDPFPYGKANFRLHLRIAKICRNAFVRPIYETLVDFVLDNVLAMPQPWPRDVRLKRQKLHEDLVAAIVAGDVPAAQRLAVKHAQPARPG